MNTAVSSPLVAGSVEKSPAKSKCCAANALTVVLNATEGRVHVVLAQTPQAEEAQEALKEALKEALAVLDWQSSKGAMELLTPLLAQGLARLGRSASDIDHVAAVCGPGSFTGLRLITATAQGLAEAVNARMAELNYLHCLAQGVPAQAGERVRVLTRAGDLIYAADYCQPEQAGLPMLCVQPLHLCRPENALQNILGNVRGNALETELQNKLQNELQNKLQNQLQDEPKNKLQDEPKNTQQNASQNAQAQQTQDQIVWLTGSACFPLVKNGHFAPDPLAALHSQLLEIPAQVRLLPPSFCQPSAAALLCLARHAHWSFNDLNPIYLRACDAEKNLEHMARQRGQDPQEAYLALRQLTEKKL